MGWAGSSYEEWRWRWSGVDWGMRYGVRVIRYASGSCRWRRRRHKSCALLGCKWSREVQKGGQWWVKKGPLNGGGWLGGERGSGGEIGEKKGDPRSIALRRHCGKLCKLEAAANYFASM